MANKYCFTIEGEESVPVVVNKLLSKGAPAGGGGGVARKAARRMATRREYSSGRVHYIHPKQGKSTNRHVSISHKNGHLSKVAVPDHIASELKEGQKVRLHIRAATSAGGTSTPDRYENMGFEGKSASPLGPKAKGMGPGDIG